MEVVRDRAMRFTALLTLLTLLLAALLTGPLPDRRESADQFSLTVQTQFDLAQSAVWLTGEQHT